MFFMKKTAFKLRGYLKHLFDRISNERLKNNLLQAIPFWIASLMTGLVAVLYATLFAGAEKAAGWITHYHGIWLLVITPACFIIAWWVVMRFAPYARGSGIPQVTAAV